VSTLGVVLAAVLAVACVIAVALPFLREPEAEEDRLNAPDEEARKRLALVEERDRALAALRELEFDHRTGKVSDEDYRALHSSLRRQAATALQAVSQDVIRVDRSLQTEHGQSPRS
jgi:transposase